MPQTNLQEYGERLRRSADAIDTAALWATKHIRLLDQAKDDPDLEATIGATEGARLRSRAKEIVQELPILAEAAGVFLGVEPVIDADALVLLDAANTNLTGERGRISIRGQALTPADTVRLQKLERAQQHIQQAIAALADGGASR